MNLVQLFERFKYKEVLRINMQLYWWLWLNQSYPRTGEWARQKTTLGKDTVNFSKLLEFLEQELEIRESADQSDEKSQTSKNKSTERGKSPLMTASGLVAKYLTCTFSKGAHSPKECSIPMLVEDRFNKVRETKACFRRFRTGHWMVACKHRKPCQCRRGTHNPQLFKTGGVKNPDAGNPLSTQNGTLLPIHFYLARVKLRRHPISTNSCYVVCKECGYKECWRDDENRVYCNRKCNRQSIVWHWATNTLMSSQLASIVPKKVVGKHRLRTETLGDVLDGEFNVVEMTARGVKVANTFTFQAVVIRSFSGVFERVEPEAYLALQEVVGGLPILANLAGPGADNIGIVKIW